MNNNIDDMLSGALTDDGLGAHADRDVIDAAVARGHTIRRRRLTFASLASVAVLGIGGIAALAVSDDSQSIKTVDSVADTTGTSVTSVTTVATVTTVTTESLTGVETTVDSVPVDTSPTSAVASTPVASMPEAPSQLATVGSIDVQFAPTGLTAAAGEVFFTQRYDGTDSQILAWSPDGLLATLWAPGCGDRCRFTELGSDGRVIWASVSLRRADDTRLAEEARAVQFDLATGDVEVMYVAPDGYQIEMLDDLDDLDDGRLLVWEVAELGLGTDRMTRFFALLDGAEVTGAEFAIPNAPPASAVVDAGGTRLAFSVADPQRGYSEIRSIDFQTGRTSAHDTSADYSNSEGDHVASPFYPIVVDWVPGTDTLLIADGWEDPAVGFLDTSVEDLDAAIWSFTSEDFEWTTQAGCVLDTGDIAISGWNIPYAEGNAELGDITIVTGQSATDRGTRALGVSLAGYGMTCLTDGRIALVTLPPDGARDGENTLVIVDSSASPTRIIELATGLDGTFEILRS